MLKRTDKSLRNLVMYSIWLRNHSDEGNFDGVKRDLDRIKKLGVDIIWFLPIHPIGEVARKGLLGSPYAVRDYRAVNPEFGTLEEFRTLVDEIHRRDMKCIIDVVFNHTSPDSWLAKNHPEWFYRNEHGSLGNKVGEWPDVIDLDYGHKRLWDYQIETLKYWAEIVDGFRCDVAPLLPLEFWIRAREEVEKVRQGCLWLAESVEPVFTIENRARGFISLSDSELYQAFDICYDYDVHAYFKGYLTGHNTLADYAAKINQQEAVYPDDYVKLRYLENHDQPRATSIIVGDVALRNWTAFVYFQKGTTLIYAGQEKGDDNRPSLFDKDPVNWRRGSDLVDLMAKLYVIKKDPLLTDSSYQVRAIGNDILYATHSKGQYRLHGVFCVGGTGGSVEVKAVDGAYKNLLDESEIMVQAGRLVCGGQPLVFASTC